MAVPEFLLFLSIASVFDASLCRPSLMASDEDINDVFQFFPDCQNDGLNLRWAHAVNSWSELNDTLEAEGNGTRVHMIEGDVIIRQPSSAHVCNDDPVPVMAHPPATDSNLTFQDWLTTINSFCTVDSQGDVLRVGAKADFKSLDAAKASLKIVQQYRDSLGVPLWLNADIVHGPGGGGSAVPVSAKEFLRTCTDYGPGLTLSVGWTTTSSVEEFRCGKGYGWLQILNIYRQILPFIRETAAVDRLPRMTFAVRAALVKPSYDRLLWLLEACTTASGGDQHKDNFSISLWTSASADQLTQDDYLSITSLRLTAGRNRVFVDLPDPDIVCLRELDPAPATNRDSKKFDPNRWKVIDPDSGVLVKGERIGVALLGRTSSKLITIDQFVSESMLLCQLVFIPSPTSGLDQNRQANFGSNLSQESIIISILGSAGDIVWTMEIAASQCRGDPERQNHNCVQLQDPEEPYSLLITANSREVKVNWKPEEEDNFETVASDSPGCDVPLNCTDTNAYSVRDRRNQQVSINQTLNTELSNFKFVIEKIGHGDFLFQKLVLGVQ